MKLGLPGLILLYTYVLVLSDSRAGWMAAMIGCGFIWYKYRGYLKIRLWMRCILLLIGVLLIIGAYYYKQDSANGRLLIWRLTADMIADSPISGHGISMFSYPSQTFLLWIMIPILLGGMNIRKGIIYELKLQKYIVYSVYIICLSLFFNGCYQYHTLQFYMKELYRSPQKESGSEVEQYFHRHRKELAALPQLLDIYAQYSFRYYPASKSLDIMKYSASIIPTSELWCDIGDLYVACNRMEEAMEAYKLSAEMSPCRVTPKYKLAMLYYDMGNISRFRLVGEDILKMKIKVESTKVLKMIAEIKLRLCRLSMI